MAAETVCSLNASSTAQKPQAMLAVVNMLGEVTRRRSPGGSWRSETTSAPEGEEIRNRRRKTAPACPRAGLRAHRVVPPSGQRPSTVRPATARWPCCTSSTTSGGTNTSIREPNFISPIRCPGGELVARTDPGHHPAGDEADDLAEVHAAYVAVDDPLHDDVGALVLDGALEPVRREPAPGAVRHEVTRPPYGVRLTCTSKRERKMLTCCQAPGGATPSAGRDRRA